MSYVFDTGIDLLRSIELKVQQTSLGTVLGEYLSLVVGGGPEQAEARPIRPGEPFSRMDRKRHLRTGEDYVRVGFEEHARPAQLIVDCGPSMDLGPLKKSWYGLAVAAAFGFKLAENRNPVSAQILTGGGINFHSPGTGQEHLYGILDAVLQAVQIKSQSGKVDLSRALEDAVGDLTQSGLVLVVSDLRTEGWEDALWNLGQSNQLVVVQPIHPREITMPKFRGVVSGVDTGQQEIVAATGQRLAQRNKDAKTKQKNIAGAVLDAGASHLVLHMERPWDEQVFEFVAETRMAKGA